MAVVLIGVALLSAPGSAPFSGPARTERKALSARGRRAAVVAVGVTAAGVLTGWWPWWMTPLLALAAGTASLRLPERRSSAQRNGDRLRLAVHADLLAACLDSGMSIGRALTVISSIGAPADETDPDDPLRLLDAVSALLLLGVDPERAWEVVRGHPDLAELAAAARRSAAGGATFADAVRDHAAALRAAVSAAADRSAGRAGVAMTAPLGLCFLPAFLCLGLAPVVVGLLGTLHRF